MSTLGVSKHSLGFRQVFNRLARGGIQSVHLDDIPAFCFSIEPRTTFMVFGAFALHLFFRGHANPDTDALGDFLGVLLCTHTPFLSSGCYHITI